MSETTERVVKEVVHNIKPFNHILVGDPLYFDDIEQGIDVENLKSITCDFDVNGCNVGAVRIQQKERTYAEFKDHVFNSIDVTVWLAKNDSQLNTYTKDRWYGEKTIKQRYDLGCDTASFEMRVNDRYDKFSTGADGYFGEMMQFKRGYGLRLDLGFDGELFSFEEIEKRMGYLFRYID